MACNPCCCSDCVDVPRQLIITVSYPAGSGVVVDKRTAEGVTLSEAVETSCVPRPEEVFVAAVRTVDSGSGYTQAPAVSLSGGRTVGSDAVITATVESPIRKIEVMAGGSGYSTAPAVSIVAPTGGTVRAAKATAVIEGAVASVALTAGGEYSSVPTVTIAGGTGAVVTPTLGGGFVGDISVTNSGSGYISNPAVKIDGNAKAVAYTLQGSIYKVYVTDKGSGYSPSTPPTVTFSGGGGQGAEAEPEMRYGVVSLAIDAGGSGYPEAPAVTFSGGGGSGAAATAAISGAVVSVEMSDAGAYRDMTKSNDPGWRLGWPTLSFSSGSAAAALSFNGGVTFGKSSGGGGYTSPPTVSVTGGSGTGAEAEAILSWSASRSIVVDMDGCSAVWSETNCTATSSTKYPPAPCLGCGGSLILSAVEPSAAYRYGENLHLEVVAKTTAAGTWTPGEGSALLPFDPRTRDPFFFSEEAAYVYAHSSWDIFYGLPDEEKAIYVKRKFSRVTPTGTLFATMINATETTTSNAAAHSMPTLGMTLPSTSPPVATPVFSRHEDSKGDVFWMLTGLSVAFGGRNLLIESGGSPIMSVWRVQGGNLAVFSESVNEIQAEVTASWSEPVVAGIVAFGVQFGVNPECSFGFTEVAEGDYELTTASVLGGTTSASNGTYFAYPVFSAGRTAFAFGYTTPSITITVADGAVTASAVIDPGLVRGPAEITSVSVAPPVWNNIQVMTRVFTGRSRYAVSRSRSQPTVEATVGGDAVLSVALSASVDQNGLNVWVVSSVGVVSGGSGYNEGQQVTFTTSGVEGRPAEATITLAAGSSAVGSVEIQNPGRFYNESITETDQLLSMECLGDLDDWEVKQFRLEYNEEAEPPLDVGESAEIDNVQVNCWQSGGSQFIDVNRTRRCPKPVLTFEFQ